VTDGEEHLLRLGELIARIKTARALDVLPYHTLGKEKYRALGMEYPLEGIPALSKDAAEKAKETILRGYRLAKGKNTQGE
jgi:pyruvate formate lyase activating enzyme